MQKTLTFTKKGADLSGGKECGVTIIAVDHFRFFMRNFNKVQGHDDSLPYVAELWVKTNDKHISPTKLCKVSNDGWGGLTMIYDTDTKLYPGINEIVKQRQWKMGKHRIDLQMDFIADLLADTCNCYKLDKTY